MCEGIINEFMYS